MEITQCDKCKTQKDGCSGLRWAVIAIRRTNLCSTNMYDICPNCITGLKDFLGGTGGKRISDKKTIRGVREAEEKAEAAVKEALGIE